MRRRKQRPAAPRPPASRGFEHTPFRALVATARQRAKAAAPPVARARPIEAAPRPLDDDQIFAQEMADVVPLPPAARRRVPPQPPPPPARVVTDPDAEALAELSDLVAGEGPFDLANTVEFVEGGVAGIDRRLVRKLRAGAFAHKSHLDLHGMSAVQARAAVDRFLARAQQRGERCVLIVHGRGLNSKDQIPVLKNRLTTWLARGSWSRLVLAFATARPCDGGTGALYVLLRRERSGKHPIHVTRGGNW